MHLHSATIFLFHHTTKIWNKTHIYSSPPPPSQCIVSNEKQFEHMKFTAQQKDESFKSKMQQIQANYFEINHISTVLN